MDFLATDKRKLESVSTVAHAKRTQSGTKVVLPGPNDAASAFALS